MPLLFFGAISCLFRLRHFHKLIILLVSFDQGGILCVIRQHYVPAVLEKGRFKSQKVFSSPFKYPSGSLVKSRGLPLLAEHYKVSSFPSEHHDSKASLASFRGSQALGMVGPFSGWETYLSHLSHLCNIHTMTETYFQFWVYGLFLSPHHMVLVFMSDLFTSRGEWLCLSCPSLYS